MATNNAIATRTNRVRRCQVEGLSQFRWVLRVTPEGVDKIQSAGLMT